MPAFRRTSAAGLSGQRGRVFEIDENTARIIRDIFRLYLRGMGYDYIQKSLKQKGYQTANGNDFSKSAINSILKNQKYMGT